MAEFIAGVQSATKVQLVFSAEMLVNSAFLDPSSYTITAVAGGHSITVVSVEESGPAPTRRATLTLGSSLASKGYYAIVVSAAVVTSTSEAIDPNTYVAQWEDMRPPPGQPIEIPIRSFSGEVTSGLLGAPDGQVFFSPALEQSVTSDSTIELEELSVCTRAYDEYHLPNPPDPTPLFTFRPGGANGLIGTSSVLWATAHRLGQAKMNLATRFADDVLPPIYDFDSETYESPISDTPALGVLVETIDTTRAAFLNDTRWNTFPGTLTFRTADNLTPIGPGATVYVTLTSRPRLDVRGLLDVVSVTEETVSEIVLPSGFDVLVTDALGVTDVATTASTTALIAGEDAITITDSVAISGVPIDVLRTDTVAITDSAITSSFYVRAAADTIDVTDFALVEFETGVVANDTVAVTDDHLVEMELEAVLADAIEILDTDSSDVIGEVVLFDDVEALDDTYVEVFSIEVIVSDTGAVTDTSFTNVDYAAVLADTLDVTDVASADTFVIEVSADDAIGVGDDLLVEAYSFEEVLSDDVSVTDDLELDIVSEDVGASDSAEVEDETLVDVTSFEAVLGDTIAVTDSLTPEADYGVTLFDESDASDSTEIELL